jgi:hypothetical protein
MTDGTSGTTIQSAPDDPGLRFRATRRFFSFSPHLRGEVERAPYPFTSGLSDTVAGLLPLAPATRT